MTLEQLKDEKVPLPFGFMRDWRGGAEGARKREEEPDVTYMIPYEDITLSKEEDERVTAAIEQAEKDVAELKKGKKKK